MLYFSTPTVLTNFLPEVELEPRAFVATLTAGRPLAELMAKLGPRLESLQVKEDRVGLEEAVLRHGPVYSEVPTRLSRLPINTILKWNVS